MTNPNNEAMREAFEAYMSDEGAYQKSIERLGESYKFMTAASAWEVWQFACKSISVTLTRNHDGAPMLSLSNGQVIFFKDIIGMQEAVKAADEDKNGPPVGGL